jgi:hypothetical protein
MMVQKWVTMMTPKCSAAADFMNPDRIQFQKSITLDIKHDAAIFGCYDTVRSGPVN